MKRCVFAFVIIYLFNIIQIRSQEWVKITPTFNPKGNYNMSLGIFIDEDNGWFTETFPGRTWLTQDGGLTWYMQIDSSAVWSYNIEFLDCNYGWIIGKRISDYIPFLKRTKDGGENWEMLSLPGEFFVIDFIDSLKGFAGGDSIYKTTDGGESWEVQKFIGEERLGIYDIYFVDEQYGWAVGGNADYTDSGIILNTIDSGKTWQTQLPITFPLNAVCFSNILHGCAVGLNVFGGGIVLTADDGGENWQTINLPSPWLNDVVFANDSTGWVVGEYGYIGYTEDGGQTWTQVESGTDADLNRIVFVDSGNVGYIFGENNTLLKYDKTVNVVGSKCFSPYQFELRQNYPNPFNPTTTITFCLPEASQVKTEVYDLTGRCVAVLCDRHYPVGTYSLQFDGTALASGIYILRSRMISIENPGKSQVLTRKMMLLK